jgi:hypothetical protein
MRKEASRVCVYSRPRCPAGNESSPKGFFLQNCLLGEGSPRRKFRGVHQR